MLVYSWRYRNDETGREFLFLIAFAFIWTAGFTLETALTSLQAKLLISNIEFLGITLLPVAWAFLVFSYTRLHVSRPVRMLFLLIPILTNIVIWTNPLHHWFMGTPRIEYGIAPFPVLYLDYQFWFYTVHAPTGYIYIIIAGVALVRSLAKVAPSYRLQGQLLLLSIALPTFTDILYVFGYSPIPYYNYTTAVFSVSGLILIWTLFKFHLLELVPLARDTIIDNLSDGILVFDHKNRIIEINPAARRSFQVAGNVLGKPMTDIENEYLQMFAALIHENQIEQNIEIGGADGDYFEVRISPVFNTRGLRIGWVATSHDITQRMNLFHKVQSMSDQDGLTGILNQRSFREQLNRMLREAKQFQDAPLTIVMIDVDYFKNINDQFGHNSGDQVLIALTHTIKAQLRKNDVFGRIGGEEFAVVLTNVQASDAYAVVERLRASIENMLVTSDGQEMRVTGSFGLISTQYLEETELEAEKILHLADQTLYRAKNAGRNCVKTYSRDISAALPVDVNS